jgi:DNA repair protein RecO (recombination protein O)
MLEHTRGIVLRNIKYSDSSSIVQVYTEHSGRISIMVRHSKSRKSLSKKSILQPLFLLDLQIRLKQNREIKYASEISNYPVFKEIPFNINKSSIALFLAEILSKVLKEEEANPDMFNFLFNSIQLLDQIQAGGANFHLVFLYELSRYLGFHPDNNYSETNKYFNLREGFYSPYQTIPEITLDEILSRNLSQISEKSFDFISEIVINRKQRAGLLESILEFYQYHLPEMGHINSLDVLNEIFNP